MTLTEEQVQTLRLALIEARYAFCCWDAEHGGHDYANNPEPNIKAAMEMVGLRWDWEGEDFLIFHDGKWIGNEDLRPSDEN